jgi:hypothetical protein
MHSGSGGSVADSELSRYHFLEQNGTPMEVCGQAGLIKEIYSQAQDAAKYKEWQDIEYLDCSFATKDSDTYSDEGYLWHYGGGEARKCLDSYYKDRGFCKEALKKMDEKCAGASPSTSNVSSTCEQFLAFKEKQAAK